MAIKYFIVTDRTLEHVCFIILVFKNSKPLLVFSEGFNFQFKNNTKPNTLNLSGLFQLCFCFYI